METGPSVQTDRFQYTIYEMEASKYRKAQWSENHLKSNHLDGNIKNF